MIRHFPNFDRTRRVMTPAETMRAFRDSRYADPSSRHYGVIYAPVLDAGVIGSIVPDHFNADIIASSAEILTRLHTKLGKAHGVYVTMFAIAMKSAQPRSADGRRVLTVGDVRRAVGAVGRSACGIDITTRTNRDMAENIATWLWLCIAEALLADERMPHSGATFGETWARMRDSALTAARR